MLQNIRCIRSAGSEGGWHLGVGGVPLCGVFISPDDLEVSPKDPSEVTSNMCPTCAEKHDQLMGGA
jgi:hypothetical protein